MTEEELDSIQLFRRVIFKIHCTEIIGYITRINYCHYPNNVDSIEICYNMNYHKNTTLEISRADALQYLSFCYATFYDWVMETNTP
jgi:hypothetical protein